MSLFGRSNVELTERVTALEGELARIKLDQAELLDKVYKWMHRAIARQRRDVQEEPVAANDAPVGSNTDPVSARILARRARHVAVPRAPEPGQLGFDGKEVE